MATIFRKTYTKPLPDGAELLTRKGQKFARWKDAKGKTRTAKVTTGKDGSARLLIEANTFTAKYRDGSGVVREAATGCRDEQAARGVLHGLLTRAERVKSGFLTAEQDRMADHHASPPSLHSADYISYLRTKRVSKTHREDRGRYLQRLSADCRFHKLCDMNRSVLERWLSARADEGMSARTRNAYRAAAIAFCNWCIKAGRLAVNPFEGVSKASEKADRRSERRAMTEDELVRLLAVAQRRPLLDGLTIRRGSDKGKPIAKLQPETRWRLEVLGRERALIYKTLVLTGLRKGELTSLTVGQLNLDGSAPYAMLSAAYEKNRQGSNIPLRADLAADLQQWLADRLEALRSGRRASGEPLPANLPADTPLFTVPKGLVRILDRDLRVADIPKVDDRGWSIDVHAMRHTFATHLSKGGVPLRTAQAALRHSDPRLTANVYTDPRLLDVAGALDALPGLPLDGQQGERQKATGTANDQPLAPTLAPDWCKQGHIRANADRTSKAHPQQGNSKPVAIGSGIDKRKRPLPFADNGRRKSGREDLNLRPPAPKAGALAKLSYAPVRSEGRKIPPSAAKIVAIQAAHVKNDNAQSPLAHREPNPLRCPATSGKQYVPPPLSVKHRLRPKAKPVCTRSASRPA